MLHPAKLLIIFGLLLLIAAGGIIIFFRKTPKAETTPPTKTTMEISSPAFTNNGFIPEKYTCDGENVNPPLEFDDVPETAKSLVLIVDDPDAPAGDWVHWTVWNIDPATTEIPEAWRPTGVIEGLTDFGQAGYGGPCPPSGTHRYQFKLYALDTLLSDLIPSAKKQNIERVMSGHIVSQAFLVGLYKKK